MKKILTLLLLVLMLLAGCDGTNVPAVEEGSSSNDDGEDNPTWYYSAELAAEVICRHARMRSASQYRFAVLFESLQITPDLAQEFLSAVEEEEKVFCNFDENNAGQVAALVFEQGETDRLLVEMANELNGKIFSDLGVSVDNPLDFLSIMLDQEERYAKGGCAPAVNGEWVNMPEANFNSLLSDIRSGGCGSDARETDSDSSVAGGRQGSLNPGSHACLLELMMDPCGGGGGPDPLVAQGGTNTSTSSSLPEKTDPMSSVTPRDEPDSESQGSTRNNIDGTIAHFHEKTWTRDGQVTTQRISRIEGDGGKHPDGTIIHVVTHSTLDGKLITGGRYIMEPGGIPQFEAITPEPTPKEPGAIARFFNSITKIRAGGEYNGVRVGVEVEREPNKPNEYCTAITPADGTQIYAPIFVEGVTQYSPEPGNFPPQASREQAFINCMCQDEFYVEQDKQLGDRAQCPENIEEIKRFQCMINPWGPDDGPRPECIQYMREDQEKWGSDFCTLIDCGPGYLATWTPGGDVGSCGCVSEEVFFNSLAPSCEVIDCGPDAVCAKGVCIPLGMNVGDPSILPFNPLVPSQPLTLDQVFEITGIEEEVLSSPIFIPVEDIESPEN